MALPALLIALPALLVLVAVLCYFAISMIGDVLRGKVRRSVPTEHFPSVGNLQSRTSRRCRRKVERAALELAGSSDLLLGQ